MDYKKICNCDIIIIGDNMKKLNELMDCEYDVEITGVKINSREIEKGNLFVCTDQGTADRHNFIDDAISKGASAVIVKRDVGEKSVPIIKVDNPNVYLPSLCSKFYDEPEKKLTMIGVTGTDGKTSVATMVQLLIGKDKCGYIGTNGYCCSKFDREIANTTPDADKLYMYFNDFLEAGCKYCSMESSSEALRRGRLEGIMYDVAIHTNITSEHLNIHGTLEQYIKDKCKLFSQVKKDGYCILNKDDEHFNEVYKASSGKVLTYGKDNSCDLYFKDVKLLPGKNYFTIVYKNKEYPIECPMAGYFNIYNLCAAILAMFALGYKFDDFKDKIHNIRVSGRLELINRGQNFYVMVDYAHTPNGITKLLEYVKLLPIKRSIVVIGQAGERDPYKRKDVGYIVCSNCDKAIFTYEDPRSEDPRDIIDMMLEKVKGKYDNYEIVIDRHLAIKRAIEIAREGDMVLILGKGNETYEKLKDEVIYFNDIEEAEKALDELMASDK